ncbi:MAG TPA: thioesterase family protein [Anaerolineae bacterium]|nr:thioesterase family protein [Anaerolineae bacterium]
MSSEQVYHLAVNIYYEDTDHSGVVYYANYLKYFERGREHAIGRDKLSHYWHELGVGFVVYKVELQYADGAVFGDVLDIRSRMEMEGKYRVNWYQEAWRMRDGEPLGVKPAVKGVVQMVCLDKNKQLVPIPEEILG